MQRNPRRGAQRRRVSGRQTDQLALITSQCWGAGVQGGVHRGNPGNGRAQPCLASTL